MNETEEREFDRTLGFLDSSQSEYLDRSAGHKKYRSRMELLGDALVLLQEEGPMPKTKLVMYKLGTSSHYVPLVIGSLLRKGYIREVDIRHSVKNYYALTEKGFQVTELYKRVKSLFTE